MGTEVRKQGIAATETEIDGLYVGGNVNKEVSVPFCKKCDCRLGKKDLRKTKKELSQERKEKAEAKKVINEGIKAREDFQSGGGALGFYILLIPVFGFFLYNTIQGNYFFGKEIWDWGCPIAMLLFAMWGIAGSKAFNSKS